MKTNILILSASFLFVFEISSSRISNSELLFSHKNPQFKEPTKLILDGREEEFSEDDVDQERRFRCFDLPFGIQSTIPDIDSYEEKEVLGREECREIISRFLRNKNPSREVQVDGGMALSKASWEDSSAISDVGKDDIIEAFLREWGSGEILNKSAEEKVVQDLIALQNRDEAAYRSFLLNCQIDYYIMTFGNKDKSDKDERKIVHDILEKAFPELKSPIQKGEEEIRTKAKKDISQALKDYLRKTKELDEQASDSCNSVISMQAKS